MSRRRVVKWAMRDVGESDEMISDIDKTAGACRTEEHELLEAK